MAADCVPAAQGAGGRARSPYCVDENAERRNHYLDLAGIENYASKFDEAGTQTPDVGPYVGPASHNLFGN